MFMPRQGTTNVYSNKNLSLYSNKLIHFIQTKPAAIFNQLTTNLAVARAEDGLLPAKTDRHLWCFVGAVIFAVAF